jgi:hypothetical protein
MNEPELEGQGYIKLLVPQQRIQEPNLPLQWCIAPALIQELEDRKVANPYLLLCVTNADGTEVRGARKLVPLNQQHVRIPFNRPGEHSIHARVVWDFDDGLLGLRRLYLRRTNGHRRAWYENEVFDEDCLSDGLRLKQKEAASEEVDEAVEIEEEDETEPVEEDENVIEVESYEALRAIVNERRRNQTISTKYVPGIGLTKLTVVIDDKLFAKPVRDWVRRWIMFPNGGNPDLIDQCDLRRRVILAFTLKPFGIALQALAITAFRAVTALFWGVLLLSKNVNWTPVVHPYRMSFEDVLPGREYFRKREIALGQLGNYNPGTGIWEYKLTAPLWFIVTPLSWVASLSTGIGFVLHEGLPMTFWNILTSTGIVFVVIFGGVTAIMLFLLTLFGILEGAERSKTAFGEWLRARARRRREAAMSKAAELAEKGEFERRFEDLVCETGSAVYRPVTELKKRSVMVIFGEVKAAVCRPFAEI